MKININYSGKILNLPASVAEFAPDASREELVVIIGIFSSVEYLDAFDTYIDAFSEKIGIGIERIKKSLAFWADKGVISIEGVLDNTQISSASNSVPVYSGAQIAKFVEQNEDIRSLFFSCQAILGKEFSSHDHNNIIYLKQYFKLGNEFILLLLAHCKELGKANWTYIRKTAQNLYDSGIDTYLELEKHFAARKNKQSLEYKIRELFGIGKREFSKSEQEKIDRWIECDLDIELIRLAYNITIDKTGKLSLAYCYKVIENWLSSGIKTVKDAEMAQNEYSNKKGSFDTDDFFEAALARSYKKENK